MAPAGAAGVAGAGAGSVGAGAASSVVGFVAQTSAAAVGAALGHLIGSTAWPLALAMAAAGCLALLLWATTRGVRVYR